MVRPELWRKRFWSFFLSKRDSSSITGLDGHNMRLIAGLIRSLAEEGRAVIMITHDVELMALAADSILYMEDGKTVYHRCIERVI